MPRLWYIIVDHLYSFKGAFAETRESLLFCSTQPKCAAEISRNTQIRNPHKEILKEAINNKSIKVPE